jgi:YVTN family beta-propeller protein
MGKVFIAGTTSPGNLYMIDPSQPAGAVTTLTSSLPNNPDFIAFDGNKLWITSRLSGTVSIITLSTWAVTTVTTGFVNPFGIIYDGTNIWVTDAGDNTIKKLDSTGAILQTVSTGTFPFYPVFDGINIWVPNRNSDTVTVVRASTGTVLATLSGNGLNIPSTTTFDGQRILVTNWGGGSVSLWKAADLSVLGTVSTGGAPYGACSDGINFWIAGNSSPTGLLRY